MEYTNDIKKIIGEAKSKFFDNQTSRFKDLDTKGLNQLVTDIDVATERYLVNAFLELIPNSSIVAEEQSGEITNADYQWIIDPLDGTTNFIHQIPVYSISVALQYKKETIAGFVLEINRDEFFWADESGAFLNDGCIQVSSETKFANTLIATGFPYYNFDAVPNYLQVLEYCMHQTRGVRRLGSAAVDLAYVACGRFDGFFEVGLSPWDVAAGAYIVQQAGGKVLDFKGEENYIFGGEIIAGSLFAADHLSDVIRTYFDS